MFHKVLMSMISHYHGLDVVVQLGCQYMIGSSIYEIRDWLLLQMMGVHSSLAGNVSWIHFEVDFLRQYHWVMWWQTVWDKLLELTRGTDTFRSHLCSGIGLTAAFIFPPFLNPLFKYHDDLHVVEVVCWHLDSSKLFLWKVIAERWWVHCTWYS